MMICIKSSMIGQDFYPLDLEDMYKSRTVPLYMFCKVQGCLIYYYCFFCIICYVLSLDFYCEVNSLSFLLSVFTFCVPSVLFDVMVTLVSCHGN